MAKKKILLTGASGFLGGNFCKLFSKQYDITGIWNQHAFDMPGVKAVHLDISDNDSLSELFNAIKPVCVVHLGAYSDPNQCQLNPGMSEKINIEASENISVLCAALNIPLLFSSTDLVFDGTAAPYSENDLPCPVNTYGLHKSIAEQVILDVFPEATICRLPLMFGASFTHGKSFLQPMLQKLANNEGMRLFTDEYRSMASARDVCAGIMLCLDQPGEIFHLGGDVRMSRFDFAKKVCTIFDFDLNLIIESKQKDVPMPAPRPADVSLISEKAKKLGWRPGTVEKELQYIKDSVK
jgi:dTDP-4-dehydrorhamnose reductase